MLLLNMSQTLNIMSQSPVASLTPSAALSNINLDSRNDEETAPSFVLLRDTATLVGVTLAGSIVILLLFYIGY